MTPPAAVQKSLPTSLPALDKLGTLITLLAIAALFLPFSVLRANRIVPGDGMLLLPALPDGAAAIAVLVLLAGLVLAPLRFPPLLKLVGGMVALLTLLLMLGISANALTPSDNPYARVAPGAGFWLLLFAFALLVTDALARLRLGPWARIGLLVLSIAAVLLILSSGAWSQVSMLKEYQSRAASFWQEGQTHLLLAFGSAGIAALVGIPLGLLCYKIAALRSGILNALNIVQTIPSIALFGLLIAPLAWVAANLPGAAALGVSGIGTTPAMVALFAYSLLPIVANTLAGLNGVPQAAREAAKGMGMTRFQRLSRVELPLAFPVILTGLRIVLVQNIGMATIAALIGGGGFGVFVFQGVGQTAMDLVLLGAVPTVALAFATAIVLDAMVELSAAWGRPA